MKYCVHCGAELHDEAVICVKCGCSVEPPKSAEVETVNDTLSIVIKVFLIIGCIAQGWMILPLAWCLPITISIFTAFKNKRPIGTGLKVCALLFVNLIAGVCLLCADNND
ncbi:MAG: hypothetical protein E7606_04830 [Ruminococcaceae bacterium]|nr:hypothetical protein [Oscillospiraceae bacterium]